MPINPIFTNAMLGVDTRQAQAKKPRERREAALPKETLEQLSDEADLASLEEVEATRQARQVKTNESEDAHEDHAEHGGYYTPSGRSLEDPDAEPPRIDVEG